jgi:hypothetical protein
MGNQLLPGTGHGRGDDGREIVEGGAGIEQTGPVMEELVAAADEGLQPGRALKDGGFGIPGGVDQGPADRRRGPGRGVKGCLSPLVRRERPAVDDPDAGQLPGPLGVQGTGRLLLDDGVDLFVEGEVVGVHSVEVQIGDVHELRRRRPGGVR